MLERLRHTRNTNVHINIYSSTYVLVLKCCYGFRVKYVISHQYIYVCIVFFFFLLSFVACQRNCVVTREWKWLWMHWALTPNLFSSHRSIHVHRVNTEWKWSRYWRKIFCTLQVSRLCMDGCMYVCICKYKGWKLEAGRTWRFIWEQGSQVQQDKEKQIDVTRAHEEKAMSHENPFGSLLSVETHLGQKKK